MKEKNIKNPGKAKFAKTKVKQKEIMSKKSSSNVHYKDSDVLHDDVKKYRATFLVGQKFRGKYYKKDESIIIPFELAMAYSQRSMIKFEQI